MTAVNAPHLLMGPEGCAIEQPTTGGVFSNAARIYRWNLSRHQLERVHQEVSDFLDNKMRKVNGKSATRDTMKTGQALR